MSIHLHMRWNCHVFLSRVINYSSSLLSWSGVATECQFQCKLESRWSDRICLASCHLQKYTRFLIACFIANSNNQEENSNHSNFDFMKKYLWRLDRWRHLNHSFNRDLLYCTLLFKMKYAWLNSWLNLNLNSNSNCFECWWFRLDRCELRQMWNKLTK